MGRYLKAILPIIIIIVGVVIARQLLIHSPKAQRTAVVTQPPQVRILQVQPQDVRIPVFSQGTVTPAVSSNISAEVTGRIIETSPQFANGGFFDQGDVLVSINPSDYELAITKAEALVATARQQLARAEAEYKQKLEEYKGVDPSKVSDYALRKPEYEEAKAKLKAAQADLNLARVQLSRCEIRAPFAGRVVEKKADVGQYVSPGMVLASVYAIDVAEVRLPLSQQQIKLLDLPPVIATQDRRDDVAVRLTGQANGKTHHWESRIVRTEATIDERNRLQYVVAQVDDPYGLEPRGSQQNNATRPALPTGLFVEAEIEGRLLQDVYVLPRLAIHNTDKVWLLDQQQRLRIRNVKLVHRGEDKAYVSEGLAPGDTLIVSPLDAVVDGMRVRVQDAAVGVMTNRE
jgi:RND family efflux transporter MFP subunit